MVLWDMFANSVWRTYSALCLHSEKDTKRRALLSQTVVLPYHLRIDVYSPSPAQRHRRRYTHRHTHTETHTRTRVHTRLNTSHLTLNAKLTLDVACGESDVVRRKDDARD